MSSLEDGARGLGASPVQDPRNWLEHNSYAELGGSGDGDGGSSGSALTDGDGGSVGSAVATGGNSQPQQEHTDVVARSSDSAGENSALSPASADGSSSLSSSSAGEEEIESSGQAVSHPCRCPRENCLRREWPEGPHRPGHCGRQSLPSTFRLGYPRCGHCTNRPWAKNRPSGSGGKSTGLCTCNGGAKCRRSLWEGTKHASGKCQDQRMANLLKDQRLCYKCTHKPQKPRGTKNALGEERKTARRRARRDRDDSSESSLDSSSCSDSSEGTPARCACAGGSRCYNAHVHAESRCPARKPQPEQGGDAIQDNFQKILWLCDACSKRSGGRRPKVPGARKRQPKGGGSSAQDALCECDGGRNCERALWGEGSHADGACTARKRAIGGPWGRKVFDRCFHCDTGPKQQAGASKRTLDTTTGPLLPKEKRVKSESGPEPLSSLQRCECDGGMSCRRKYHDPRNGTHATGDCTNPQTPKTKLCGQCLKLPPHYRSVTSGDVEMPHDKSASIQSGPVDRDFAHLVGRTVFIERANGWREDEVEDVREHGGSTGVELYLKLEHRWVEANDLVRFADDAGPLARSRSRSSSNAMVPGFTSPGSSLVRSMPVSSAQEAQTRVIKCFTQQMKAEGRAAASETSRVPMARGECRVCRLVAPPFNWPASNRYVLSSLPCECGRVGMYACDIAAIIAEHSPGLVRLEAELPRAINRDRIYALEVRELEPGHPAEPGFGLYNGGEHVILAGSLLGDATGVWNRAENAPASDSSYIIDYNLLKKSVKSLLEETGFVTAHTIQMARNLRFDVDAEHVGNEFRYMNAAYGWHEANVSVESAFVRKSTGVAARATVVPCVLVWAMSDIPPGAELLLDYGESYSIPSTGQESLEKSLVEALALQQGQKS